MLPVFHVNFTKGKKHHIYDVNDNTMNLSIHSSRWSLQTDSGKLVQTPAPDHGSTKAQPIMTLILAMEWRPFSTPLLHQ